MRGCGLRLLALAAAVLLLAAVCPAAAQKGLLRRASLVANNLPVVDQHSIQPPLENHQVCLSTMTLPATMMECAE